MRFKKLILPLSISMILSPSLSAKDNDDQDEKEAENIVVLGSRAAPRSVSDSAVPIDIISRTEFSKQASTDMVNLLSTAIPSFVVNEQPISDAATLVRPANLRGLSPDSTLILVNGKRRHRSAVISFLGGGISDGAQGPDISVFPNIAIERVEVLRDGAAAQYGSDAIAGVINFVLREDSEGFEFETRYGEFYEGDGETMVNSLNFGMPLGLAGFANFSAEIKNNGATSRSVQRDDALALIEEGNNSAVNDPAQIWGSPELQDDMKVFANLAYELSDSAELYLFGNWAQRDAEGGFYFRNPNTRSGVFSNDGGASLLVGDLDKNDNVSCDPIPVVNHTPDFAGLDKALNDPSCFVFNELFPGGFTPRFGGRVSDKSLALGINGELDSGVFYDVSYHSGENEVAFILSNTVNASLGPDTPTKFQPGRYVQAEDNINANFSYALDVDGMASPLNIAAGVEYRKESFEIYAGDPASYAVGPLAEQGFGIGSNGFPGFKPEDAGIFSRSNYAVYTDLELKPRDALFLGLAVRYEDFDDFGSTLNGKLAGRFEFTPGFALRSSLSTGFRAPTVGQANVRNVTTAFGPNGLQDEATLPPTHPISVQLGGKPLEPEESTSFTFGSIYEFDAFYFTIDYFRIKVTDRISQTSTLPLSQADIDTLVGMGVEDALSYTGAKFFTNDFDTTTQGIDLITNFDVDLGIGSSKVAVALNWTDTEVDAFNPEIISDTKVRQLEENVPQYRGTVTFDHKQDRLATFVRLNYFGSFYEAHLDDGSLPIEAGAKFTVDTEFGYEMSDSLFFAIGARNLLNEYPDKHEYSGIAGAPYPVTSPMGFNGGFYYTRFFLNF